MSLCVFWHAHIYRAALEQMHQCLDGVQSIAFVAASFIEKERVQLIYFDNTLVPRSEKIRDSSSTIVAQTADEFYLVTIKSAVVPDKKINFDGDTYIDHASKHCYSAGSINTYFISAQEVVNLKL